MYNEPVVVPAQKVETEVAAKQEEVSTGNPDAAQEIYKAAVVKGAFAVSVPVALNQAKQKVIPKPLPDAQSSMPMPPSPEDPEKGKGKQKAEVDLKEKAREILRESEELRKLDSIVEKLKKTTSDRKFETHYTIEKDIEKIDLSAEKIYQGIRDSKADIERISSNTTVPEGILQKIKDHVFHKEHLLKFGKQRFAPDLDIADVWMRLTDGDFVQSDLVWLQHEYSESLIMDRGIDWKVAHRLTNNFYNWQAML